MQRCTHFDIKIHFFGLSPPTLILGSGSAAAPEMSLIGDYTVTNNLRYLQDKPSLVCTKPELVAYCLS